MRHRRRRRLRQQRTFLGQAAGIRPSLMVISRIKTEEREQDRADYVQERAAALRIDRVLRKQTATKRGRA